MKLTYLILSKCPQVGISGHNHRILKAYDSFGTIYSTRAKIMLKLEDATCFSG